MSSVLPPPEEYERLAPRPGSPVWRAFNDPRMFATSGYATLLQVAHPTVGHGVHQYSSFTKDPWGRLLRTLDYVHGTIYGGPELAGTIGRRVREMHRTIKGTKPDGSRYHAMEPEAFAWVHATLGAAIVHGNRAFATPMGRDEREAFWAQWLDVGRLIGVRARDLPGDWDGAQAYVDRMVDEVLEWTPAIPEVMATLERPLPPDLPGLGPGVWRVVSAPLSLQVRVATTGLLPPRLRTRLRLRYTRRDEATFRAVAAASRAAGPVLRGRLREFGPQYVRWRREALARGDVANPSYAPQPRAAVPA
ncbi:MAG: DUF2236 domain-containing protein [Solirubrobacterales bacterium]|nr:DUF2236 domain-containing protein [Solirubrobacterales bacterium]